MKNVSIINKSIFLGLIVLTLFSCNNLSQKGKVATEETINKLTLNVQFEDCRDFVIIPCDSYEISWQRLEDENIESYRSKISESRFPSSIIVNLSFKKIWKQDLQLELSLLAMRHLLYFEVLEKEEDVIFCYIQDLYKCGTKDSLVFRKNKTNDEYELAEAFRIDIQDEYDDMCVIYKINFIQKGNYIDLVTDIEEFALRKKYKIGKLDQYREIDDKYKTSTLLINGSKFIQTKGNKTNNFYCLTTIKGDTIIPLADYYSQIDFLDINEDGTTDIRIYVFSNTPNECENYLFDRNHEKFRLIENCWLDVQKIRGTNFYYSYVAVGCSDYNWVSYLSRIENYQLVDFGRIAGQNCGDKSEINIYKIVDGEEFLITKLPYTQFIPKNDDKWRFVKEYWETNYLNFE